MTTSSTTLTLVQQRHIQQRTRRRLISAGAFAIILVAWLYGYFNSAENVRQYVPNVLPGAGRIEVRRDLYIGYGGGDGQMLIGYAQVGSAPGYAGPVEVLVGVDPSGTVIGAQIISHHETPGFFRLLGRNKFLDQFLGRKYDEDLYLGEAIDGVSGATFSSDAVATSIRQTVREIAQDTLDFDVPPDHRPIQFGAPEFALLGLFATSFALRKMRHQQIKRYGRWAILLAGILVLGFLYNKPFTLAHVVSLLVGYWPDYHNNLYWFLLLGGILGMTLIQGKNPYCSWFCPFGGVQELLGTLTGARNFRSRRLDNYLRWLQRWLAFSAIVLGLALRMPGVTSYEPFGTIFDLNGTWPQWVLLVLVLLAAVIINRPFCNYLCPLAPVVDYVADVRSWIRDTWRNRKTTLSKKSS